MAGIAIVISGRRDASVESTRRTSGASWRIMISRILNHRWKLVLIGISAKLSRGIYLGLVFFFEHLRKRIHQCNF